MDLTDLLPSYAPHYFSSFSQEEIDSVTYNERLYTIPYGKGRFYSLIAVTSQKLMEKYGIEKIETFEDLTKYTNMVEKKEIVFYPLQCDPMDGFWEFVAAHDGYALCDGYVVYRRDDPEMKLIPFEETDTFKNWALFLNRYPMTHIYTSTEKKPASYIKHYYGLNPSPLFDKDTWVQSPLCPGIELNNNPLNIGWFISSQSQHAKEVLQFINWLNSSPENFLLLNYGFEGTDYSIEDGKIVPKGDIRSRIFNRFIMPFKSEFEEMFPEKEPIVIFDRFNSLYASSFPPHNGFNPSLDLREELAKRNKAFYEMQLEKLCYGSLDINEFIEEMKSLGTQSILVKYQDELDE